MGESISLKLRVLLSKEIRTTTISVITRFLGVPPASSEATPPGKGTRALSINTLDRKMHCMYMLDST